MLMMASVGTWSTASRAHVSQVRLSRDLFSVPRVFIFLWRTPDRHGQEQKAKSLNVPTTRGGRVGHVTPACSWATTHRKSPTQKAAYPLLLSEQRHHCDPHLLLCGMWKGQQSPLILSWWWWGTAVLLMRFFSRSAIYIWDRHPPPTPPS